MSERSAPQILGSRTYDSAAPARILLTLFVAVLFLVPSKLIVGPLGGAGTPAEILGLCFGTYWAAMRAAGWYQSGSATQPIRRAALLFLGAVLASYLAAATRPIDGDELRSADLGLLMLIGWIGLVAFVTDAVPSIDALRVILRRMVAAGGAIATLGLAQFVTKMPLTNYIQIPGLSSNSVLTSVYDRGGLTRPAGTALHPIEFGSVLTMTLPLALHFAMSDTGRSVLRRWYPVLAIAIAVPISISRSAIVATVVVLAVILPTWAKPVRRRAYAAFVVLSGCLYVLVPGLLGTLTGLFTGISGDSSAQSRTGSYALASHFIANNPVFGRGFLTFLPAYRILDNQYLGLLIDTGIVGVLALLTVFTTGFVTARRVRRTTFDPDTASLAQALAAAISSAAVSFALFDAFSFPMAASLVFFLLGAVGCLWRLSQAEATANSSR